MGTHSKKYFDLSTTHFKNLYAKQKNEINPNNLEDIFKYSKDINNFGEFCRGYEEKILINEKNEKFNHKHMIFFSNFDFKRLYVSKHILIDGTYVFPSGFVQTIIILYYDYIVFKFIPSIYILINNKNTIGYEHAFRDINEYIIKYKSKIKEELQWETYTSDFELALSL